MASLLESKGYENVELLVAHKSKQIEKMEVNFNMLYELVPVLSKRFHSLVSILKIYIGYVIVMMKEEETVYQLHGTYLKCKYFMYLF